MTHVDLFSGIGGFALAAQWAGFRTVVFCEIEPYCQEIIKARFGAVADTARDEQGRTEQRPIGERVGQCSESLNPSSRPRLFRDIRTFAARDYRGATLLTGGFPCQPFSQAGKRRGKEDDRYLWPEMLRVISEARPAWVVGENVAGIIGMELDRVLSDLEGEGYAVQPLVIPACAVDAKHRRDRVWIVAHSDSARDSARGIEGSASTGEIIAQRASERIVGHAAHAEKPKVVLKRPIQPWDYDIADAYGVDIVPDPDSERQPNAERGTGQTKQNGRQVTGANAVGCRSCEWLSEPDVGVLADGLSAGVVCQGDFCQWPEEPQIPRVATGIKNRVDQLRGLGNSIVPQVAYEILEHIAAIVDAERDEAVRTMQSRKAVK